MADEYAEEYGDIEGATVVGYHKFEFSVDATTTKGYLINIRAGGDHNNIYRYDPWGDWEEHKAAGIVDVRVIEGQ